MDGVPPVGGHGLIDGRVVSLPTSAGALAVSPLFSWRAKLEYARVMTAIKKLDPRRVEGMSFREWVEMNVDDAMVRTVMYRSARVATDCAEPETQAAGPVLRQLKLVLGGGNLYVDGGWAALVEGLRRRAEGYGVVGNAGRAVVRIRRSKHAATERTGEASFVVDLGDGGRCAADQVVLAVPPATGCRLLQGSEETSLAAWRDGARPITVACLDLALRRLPRPSLGFVMGIDTPVLLSDQTRAARGRESELRIVHLLKYQRDGGRYAEADLAQLTEVIDRLQPGWRDEVVASRYLPKMTVMYDHDHVARTTPPGPRIPEVPGLYVAGDWSGHGELLADAAAASAKRAAVALLEDRKAMIAREVHGNGWRNAL